MTETPPTTAPVWLLDVDGVINANRPGWGATPRSGMAYSGGYGFRIRWAPALIDRIRALHTAGLVEVRWCSTWCPDAGQLERLLRLPSLSRALDMSPVPGGAAGWPLKLAAARQVLADGRLLVWTDDEAIPGPGAVRDALETDGRALLIAPKSNRGLQPADMDAIEAFTYQASIERSAREAQ